MRALLLRAAAMSLDAGARKSMVQARPTAHRRDASKVPAMTEEILLDAYRQIDDLLEARAGDHPRRVEPVWGNLLAAIDEVAQRLRAGAERRPALSSPTRLPAFYEEPVFVVGHRKTGTTLVLDLLDAHPALVVLPGESNHFRQFRPRFDRGDAGQRAAEAQRWWLLRLISPSGIPPFWAAGKPWELDSDPYERFTHRLLDLAAANPDRDVLGLVAVALSDGPEPSAWVEKTPGHELCADEIFDLYPRARFVHVLRDPRAVAAATKRLDRATAQETDLVTLGLNVRSSFVAAERNRERLGENRYLVLRYEELVAEPEPTMRQVAGFLGIEFRESLLVPTVGGVEATSNSSWTERKVTGAIESRRLDLWREELDESSASLVAGITAPAAARAGYCLPRDARARALALVGLRRARFAIGTRRRGLQDAVQRKTRSSGIRQ
jgi:hypothetical protein